MSNEELIKLGQMFNVIPGTKLGAKGYLGARIQPNSPTDHPDDVVWQTLDAFAYATGDIVIGTNPVDSQVESVAELKTRSRMWWTPSSLKISSPGACFPTSMSRPRCSAVPGNGGDDVPEPRRHR